MDESAKVSDNAAPRWTNEAELVGARALARSICGFETTPAPETIIHIRAVLTALADAGLLAQPGIETEYGREGRMFGGDGPPNIITRCQPEIATHVRQASPWRPVGEATP